MASVEALLREIEELRLTVAKKEEDEGRERRAREAAECAAREAAARADEAAARADEERRAREAAERAAREAAARADEAAARADEERRAREAAEQRLLTQELESAANMERERLATFMAKLVGMGSANAAETSSNSDVVRRGAPEVIVTADTATVLRDLPVVSTEEACIAWKQFQDGRPKSVPVKRTEVARVHPVIMCMLDAAQPVAESRTMRLWLENIAEDSIPRAEMKPDAAATHIRDTALTLLGSTFILELKLPGLLNKAVVQALQYGRRRVLALCEEALAQDDTSKLADVSVLVAGSDGRSIVFARVFSGAPSAGSFRDAVPCPCYSTTEQELLSTWDIDKLPVVPTDPPVGFITLMRILRAAPATLGSVVGLPLPWINVRWAGTEGVDRLELGERLGSGGSSDVYRLVEASAADRPAVSLSTATHTLPLPASLIVKLARAGTAGNQACMASESFALEALRPLAASMLVPTLYRTGYRVGGLQRPGMMEAPLVVLSPAGVPLSQWLLSRLKGAPASHHQAICVTIADAVLERVLMALKGAHSVNLVHCDVRPSNIVMYNDSAVLVDWGLSRAVNTNIKACGVRAFTDANVFGQSGCRAQPALDIQAAAYTWIAIAWGHQCSAPWSHTADELVFSERKRWLEANDARLAKIADLLAGRCDGTLYADAEAVS